VTWSASITVDVDGVAGLPDGGRHHVHRLTSRSERLYGIARGLPRILALLDAYGVRATFYVPGVVACEHAEELRRIVARGHEVGHHGHTHRRPDTLTAEAQEREVAAGIDALVAVTGERPRGYRAPGWELAPPTLSALVAHGFAWDSSLMGDDRPYVLEGGLVELPVHWSLDDAPHFSRSLDPAPLLAAWIGEADAAAAEGRHVTYTLHPDVLGRAHRVAVLERLLAHLTETGAALVTHGEAASPRVPPPRTPARRS
jgi:peptidoglycan/xylan/chitin deacetylase (PgdA/CDA1 family)